MNVDQQEKKYLKYLLPRVRETLELINERTGKNYKTAPDRQMLYVACTRAMHHLLLCSSGKISDFISE